MTFRIVYLYYIAEKHKEKDAHNLGTIAIKYSEHVGLRNSSGFTCVVDRPVGLCMLPATMKRKCRRVGRVIGVILRIIRIPHRCLALYRLSSGRNYKTSISD